MTIRHVIQAKSIAYQNDSRNDRFKYEIHYRDRSIPLMRINYYIYAEDEKTVPRGGKVAFRKRKYATLNNEARIF